MMMFTDACIIGGAMDGNRHLSIAGREDITVRWKGYEGISQIARELGRDKSVCFRQDRSFMDGTQNFQAWHCKFSCSARHAA